ncbi:MAG: TonB-dependent receptor [Gammaproteobacteria bacterium]|nr:TonB-dependent receptor [Gammaproteobacteria bacterium]
MHLQLKSLHAGARLLSVLLLLTSIQVAAQEPLIEEIVVWGSDREQRIGTLSPDSILTPEDFRSINVATTEDLVKFEPSVVVRRRFIGDSNGVLGMRGSNMFQTSRSMVFADGVPLHYLLQSRWNGAPRWTMVSASEIAQVETLYGPFSAEYSGNAMGGVVNIETAIPQQQEFHFDSSYFSQAFNDYGFDGTVNGHKSFLSYGNKFGDTSVYLSYNHLRNDSQPQTFRAGNRSTSDSPMAVTGTIVENDDRGRSASWFMDTGIVDTETHNYKFKLGHDFGNWSTLLNIAYEDRSSMADAANTYLRDSKGNPVYNGHVIDNGRQYFVPASRFATSDLQRDSLNLGLRLRGQLTETIELETNVSRFEVLRDENRNSSTHPDDPNYTTIGQIRDFGDTGWDTAEVKLTFDELGVDGLSLISGVRHESYELNLDIFRSDNYISGEKTSYSSRSGGETELLAVFAQFNWQLTEQWDAAFGIRWEDFESSDGYFDNDDPATVDFDLTKVPARSDNQVSPKFTLGYRIDDLWSLRYSVAQAYRFPIVEELFSQYEAYNTISISSPGLNPEDGVHHNVMVERILTNGYLRVNLFTENIEDVIESQTGIIEGGTSLRTFLPIGEIETSGIEFITNARDLFIDRLDVRFNLVYTDSEIVRNAPNPSIEGNIYPRMPEWRGNLLASYRINSKWDAGINFQYASDSFGRTDNMDIQDNVYGAQDGFERLGVKSTYRMDNGLAFGFGVDNLTNEVAYVAHPWPGRTYYLNLAYDL